MIHEASSISSRGGKKTLLRFRKGKVFKGREGVEKEKLLSNTALFFSRWLS